MGSKEVSPGKKALQRLLKNKPAVFGLIVIAFAILLAIFGHLIVPDKTPNANDQVVEIAQEKPGFKIKMLYKKKNKPAEKSNWFSFLLNGKSNEYEMIPLVDYNIEGDTLYASLYAGKNVESGKFLKGKDEAYNLADIVNPLSIDAPSPAQNGKIAFVDVYGKNQTADLTYLRDQIENEQIKERTYFLGTDRYGRSILSRLVIGVRISLSVGLIAVIISLTIGILIGAIGGYFGGRIDDMIMMIINTVWAIPTLLLVFAIVLAFGRGIETIFIAVGLTMWVDVARIVRGQVFALRETQFVEAAQSMGFGHGRIIGRHILPNILGPVMVIAAANFATAILVEAGLSFLGFGIQPPRPSWGSMLNDNYGYLVFSNNPWPALLPCLAIMLMVLAFNLVGNGFRDALDVQTNMDS